MIFLLVVLDFATKIVTKALGLGILNQGVTFGYLDDVPGGLWIAVQVGILAVVVVWLVRHQPRSLSRWGAILLIAGGVGNLISRLLLDGVWDWIAFGSWFHFNLADAMIDTGIVLFLIGYISGCVGGAGHDGLPRSKDRFN